MGSEKLGSERENSAERLSRWGRNFNLLGALAIAGVAAVIPGPNVVLASWAGLNFAQAGGFELLRQGSKKKKNKRKKASAKDTLKHKSKS